MLRQLLARVEALEAAEPSPKKSSKRHLPGWLLKAWIARGLRVGRHGQPDQDALRRFFSKPRSLRRAADAQNGDTAFCVTDKENAAEDEAGGDAEE